MELEECRAYAMVREDYRVLARCEVKIELPKGYPMALAFYQKMADAAVRWTEEFAGGKAREEYAALTGFWEKTRFLPYRFRLFGEPFLADKSHFVVLCNSVYTHGAQREVRRAAQVWNATEQTILPLRQVEGIWYGGRPKKQHGFSPDGGYPKAGKLILFQNPRGQTPFSERELWKPENKNEKL